MANRESEGGAKPDSTEICMMVHTLEAMNRPKSVLFKSKVYIFRLTSNISRCYTPCAAGWGSRNARVLSRARMSPHASHYTHRKYGAEVLVP
jgi:hypothetical protein